MPARGGEPRRADQLLLGVLAVDEVAHPLAGPVRGHGEHPGPAAAKRVHELLR